MAFTSAGFPAELVNEVFVKAQGKSSIARLAGQRPVAFSGSDIMTFEFDGEVNIVAEGAAKGQHTGKNEPVSMVPIKIEYGQRISNEFQRCSDEKKIEYLRQFSDGFAKKVARGLDIMAMHGINPATGAPAATIGKNCLDKNEDVTPVEYSALTPEANIESAVEAIGDYDLTGIIMDKTLRADLAKLTVNGVKQYPELAWGNQPGTINGTAVEINSTVSKVQGKHAYAGNFEDAFKWGYAGNIPLEVIEYGDPDNSGHDLKGYNQVYLRTEAWIGWAILDGSAFARIVEEES